MKALINRCTAALRRTTEYLLVSHWRVQATVEEVYEIINMPGEFTAWWGDVVLNGQRHDIATETGVIPTAVFTTKGFLPYTLRFQSIKTEDYAPYGYATAVTGDFEGSGRWQLKQEGDAVSIRFQWSVRVQKPLLRRLSWLLRPLFIANHRWTMRRGHRGLQAQLLRRRGTPARPCLV